MNKDRVFRFATVFVLIMFLIVACDAPRQNPFDPKASNYNDHQQQLVVSKIFVKHLFPPFDPIANANLIIQNLHLFLTSDAQGSVTFEHAPVDSFRVLTDADGYFNRSFAFRAMPSHEYTIYLNAKPQVAETRFISTYTNLEQSNSTTNLSFEAMIYDADGPMDINRVLLKNDDYNFALSLLRDPNNNNHFKADFSLSDIDPSGKLNNGRLPELNFYLLVQNLNNDSITSGEYSVRRVIETELQLLSPAEGQTVRDSVVFNWINPELPYDYTFTIQLYKYPTFDQIFYRNIPGDQNRWVVKDLAKGQYSWSLQVEDKLGNICQSYYINFYYE